MSSPSLRLLSDFTSETLGHISKYCQGEVVSKLLACGSPILSSKLASASGVREFRIYRPAYYDLGSLNTIIPSFSALTDLTIVLNSIYGSFPSINSTVLKNLPKCVTKIDFRFFEAEECWIRAEARSASNHLLRSPPFAFVDYLPHLQHLRLRSILPDLDSQYLRWETQDVMCLPPSLTYFSAPQSRLTMMKNWAHLPNLTFLKVAHMDTLEQTPLENMSALQTLDVFAQFHISDDVLVRLPSNLTQINFPMAQVPGELFSALPRTLLCLDLSYCSDITSTHLLQLPPNLTDLSIGAWEETTDGQPYLPETITSLRQICGGQLSPDPVFTCLPPQLRCLKFVDFETRNPCTIAQWRLLPKTLKILRLWFSLQVLLSHYNCEISELLPIGLEELILKPKSGWFEDTAATAVSPPSLKILNLDHNGIFYRTKPLAILPDSPPPMVSVLSAVRNGDLETLQWLKELGANFRGDLNGSLLTRDAAEFGHLHVLEWLYEVAGVPFDLKQPVFGYLACETASAAAYHCIRSKDFQLLDWLADRHVRLENTPVKEQLGIIPSASVVHIAAAEGSLELFKWCHLRGLDLNKVELDQTPIEIARERGFTKCVEWLECQKTTS